MKRRSKLLCLLLAVVLLLSAAGCAKAGDVLQAAGDIAELARQDAANAGPGPGGTAAPTDAAKPDAAAGVQEDGEYTSRDDVALYIYTFGHLPGNFITKAEARALGWEGGGLERYAPGKSIGGDAFGNREGLLPKAQGRTYTECDIDTAGASSRGAERIVFSNDGLIYYTGDHYESFTLLYGEG